jgi:hypothetical protein
MKALNIAVEGVVDGVVAERIARFAGFEWIVLHGRAGKNRLDDRIKAYNHAARLGPWFVLRDLDHDASCGAELSVRLLPSRERLMCLRVVVREIEAWMLADRVGFSDFFRVSSSRVPAWPDTLDDPKQALLTLIAGCKLRDLREDMLPRRGSVIREGPLYTSRLSEYVGRVWDPTRAANASDSLRRAMDAITSLASVT